MPRLGTTGTSYIPFTSRIAFEAGEYTTSVVIEDAALAGHLLTTFEALWDAAPAKQVALISHWEASRS